MKRGVIYFFLILVSPIYLFSAFDVKVNSARIAGMGNNMSVDKYGYDVGFSNPAMLDDINKFSVLGCFSPMLVGIDNGSINAFSGGVAYKFKKYGSIGVSYNGLNVSSFDENIYGENMIKFLYGKNITKNFSAGVYFSLLKWKSSFTIFDNSYTENYTSDFKISYGFGVAFRIMERLRGGATVENINTPDISSGSEEENLPFTLNLGFIYWLEKKRDVVAVFNMEYKNIIMNYSTGFEMKFLHSISARLGMEFIDSGNGINLTVGGGYTFSQLDYDISIDYALVYPIINLSDTLGTHIISANLKF